MLGEEVDNLNDNKENLFAYILFFLSWLKFCAHKDSKGDWKVYVTGFHAWILKKHINYLTVLLASHFEVTLSVLGITVVPQYPRLSPPSWIPKSVGAQVPNSKYSVSTVLSWNHRCGTCRYWWLSSLWSSMNLL